ncbi:MAG: chromate transporter [Bacteroidales bacterium]|nr:chromate transporter [Bacteroidales bacterium]
MIFWKLFYTFCKIGIFNFGGGYAMLALIQNEVVEKNGWMTSAEFTDIVATSQVTPGPIGINVATYAGYTAVINAGYDPAFAVLGAFLSSFSVILLPFIAMLLVSRYLLHHKDNPVVKTVLTYLKLAVVGLIAAAALLLVSPETFGSFAENPLQFCLSIALFAAAFFASLKWKTSPILLILLAGVVGFAVYYLPTLVM